MEERAHAAREGMDNHLSGPGGPSGGSSGGMRSPPYGGMVQKSGFGVARELQLQSSELLGPDLHTAHGPGSYKIPSISLWCLRVVYYKLLEFV